MSRDCVFFPADADPDFLKPFSTTMTLASLANWKQSEGKPWSKRRCKRSDSIGSHTIESQTHGTILFLKDSKGTVILNKKMIRMPFLTQLVLHSSFMTFLQELKNMGPSLTLTAMETYTSEHGTSTMRISDFVNIRNFLNFQKIGEDGSETLASLGGDISAQMRRSRFMSSSRIPTEAIFIGLFTLTS